MATQHEVVDHRQVREQGEVLERPSDPELCRVGGLEVEQFDTGQSRRPGLGAVDGVQAVEDRRLPGAVRTDDREELALVDVVADVGQCRDATERQRDVSDFEQGRCGHRILHQEPQCFWRR